jgi:sensor c-di-GMP phosphodiesterase-like protein
MQALRGRVPGIAALALLGTLLGSILGFWLGRAILLRSAKAGLAEYTDGLTHHADEVSAELRQVFNGFESSESPFCSDEELAVLRTMTFRARDFKDIGRTRDGVLYCSALLGRLAKPYREGTPSLTLTNGINIYTNVPVVLASAGGGRASVLEFNDIDVVLSPEAFDYWGRPRVGYAIKITDSQKGQSTTVAGSGSIAGPNAVLGQGFRTASGILFSSRCSQNNPVCVTTAQSIADIWAGSRATVAAYVGMGGVAGFCLGFAVALLYLRTEGLRFQLRRALRRNSSSLRTVYEPILDVKTGRCVGAEALMRWKDEDGVSVSPDVFIRLAEDSGFIGGLTAWVVRHAAGELATLLLEHPGFALSINIAAADLEGDALFEILDLHVLQAGIDPTQIILEMTERSTADLAHVRRSIQRLAAAGFKVYVDDFGTGFSSLSYLDQLEVSAIKVDRCFTRTIGTDAVTVSILPQMLAMAESLHLDVIIEGVETEAQLLYLQNTQKPLRVQGWYFSQPLSAKELLIFLERTEQSEYWRTHRQRILSTDPPPEQSGKLLEFPVA